MRQVIILPLSCVFFALYPLVYFWSLNHEEVLGREILLIAIVLLSLTFFVFYILKYILNDATKATLGTCLFLYMFISFEHFFDCESTFFKFLSETLSLNYFILLPFWVIIFTIFTTIIHRSTSRFSQTSNGLLLFSCFFFIPTLVPLIKVCYTTKSYKLSKTSRTKISLSKTLPNIYYIILDGYSRHDILEQLYEYNNTSFLQFLKNKGFFIADQTLSNYGHTACSVPSTLDMNLLDYPFDGKYYTMPLNYSPKKQLANSRIFNILRKHGYKIIHVSPQAGCTLQNPNADQNLNLPFVSIFSFKLFNRTFLGPFLRIFNIEWRLHYHRIQNTLKSFRSVPQQFKDGPYFFFYHIIAPHEPLVMDEHGDFRIPPPHRKEPPGAISTFRIFAPGYIQQMKGLNKKMEEVINIILSHSSVPPIIIVQGDHGNNDIPRNIPDKRTEVKYRYACLNAYYLPQLKNFPCPVYNTITPINSFRIILNYYLGTNFAILEDKIVYYEVEIERKMVAEAASSLNKISLKNSPLKYKEKIKN